MINEGSFDVYIIQGSALVIDTQDDLRNNYPMKLYVHTADISEVKLSGSGSIRAYDLILQECNATISGSGSMYLTVEDYLD